MLWLTLTVTPIVHISTSVSPVTTWKLRRRKHQKSEYHQKHNLPPHLSLDSELNLLCFKIFYEENTKDKVESFHNQPYILIKTVQLF